MNWSDVKATYPEQWVLLQADTAHSEGARRVVVHISVISAFDDSEFALRQYLELHREDPSRELYVAHTSRKELEIKERRRLGIRSAA